jgi:geranylgeranyl pyrophosphate synthase
MSTWSQNHPNATYTMHQTDPLHQTDSLHHKSHPQWLLVFKEHFDAQFLAYIQAKISSYTTFIEKESTVSEWLHYLIQFAQWWKRIRPYLLDLTYRLCVDQSVQSSVQSSVQHDNDARKSLGYVLELLQLFLLIHDDITDQGTIRHDIPTYHTYLSTLYKDESWPWISQGIIIGDIVYTWVWQDLASLHLPYEIMTQFAGLITHVALWQMLDIDYSYQNLGKQEEQIITKDMLKTATYTFIMPMLMWSQLAWVEPDIQDKIVAWAHDIWITFQMRDDLMDLGFFPTNKTVFSDHSEWNQTYLLTRLWCQATDNEKIFINDVRRHILTTEQSSKLISLYTKYDIIQDAIEEINARLEVSISTCQDIFPYASQKTIDEICDLCRYLFLTQPDKIDNLPLKKQ